MCLFSNDEDGISWAFGAFVNVFDQIGLPKTVVRDANHSL
jgi:hypothetical protein